MNYDQLEKFLQSNVTYANNTDETILEHFKKSFDSVPYENDVMYILHHEREFLNKNHIVQLHERDSGSVPLHIFHYIVFTYIYSGSFKMRVEQDTITLNQGDIIILDKHVPHSVRAIGPDDLGINIILNDDYFAKKFINKLPSNKLLSRFIIELMSSKQSHTHYLVLHTNGNQHIKNCIDNILCEYFDSDLSSDDIIDNYIMILITYLARSEHYNTNLSVDTFKNQKLLEDIIEYIKNNYVDGNLNNMCHIFGYDPSYTSKLIKKFSGKSFKQLVNEERMKHALMLLHNKDVPIYDIAQDIGFNNLTSFYKKFQEYNKCTPQEYRNKMK